MDLRNFLCATEPGTSKTDDSEVQQCGAMENPPHEKESENNSDSYSDDSEDEQLDSQPGINTTINEVHPAICSGDFGKVIELASHRSLTDHEKYVLLKQHFIPTSSYKFPCRTINHQQRSCWLCKYNGLVYSESQDGGYCKFCVLFGKCESKVKKLGVLVTKPFTNFKKASEKLSDHFLNSGKAKFHQSAMQDALTFIAVMEKEDLRIDHQINSERSRLISKNQLKVRSIV